MILKNTLALLALAFAASASAAYPAGYYDALDGKTGHDLMLAAKGVVSRHTVISYGDQTWNAFKTTDVIEINGREAWWDMYSNNVVYVSEGHSGLNIEHSVANSWWGKTKNDAYKDLFHLNPSDATANNRKANYPLGEISGTPYWDNGVTFVGTPVAGQGGGASRVFEPLDKYKGDFARAFMYVFTVYNDISWKDNTAWMYSTTEPLLFRPWARELLLKWNDLDPVDEKESNRNEAIYKIQKNRNPYIDLPTMCHYIWGELSGTAFHPGGGGDTPNPPTPPTQNGVLLDMNFDTATSISAVEAQGWWNDVVSGSLKGWYVTSFDGNYYAAASAYKGTETGGPYEFWLVTPALNVAPGSKTKLSFRTQGAYADAGTTLEVYSMTASDPRTATLTKLDAAICQPNPVGNKPVYSDWLNSGEIALPESDNASYIGFRYYSEQGGSGHTATYCLDDVKVVAEDTGAIDRIEQNDNILVAAGCRGAIRLLAPVELTNVAIYDLSGNLQLRQATFGGELTVEVPAGLYIVTADGTKPLKVLVK